MKYFISALFFSFFLLSLPTGFADEDDINIRMMPNNANNQINHMRLNALVNKTKNPDQDPLKRKTIGSTFNDDCTLNIGNNLSNQGLLSKPQPIIITGPVINKCR